MTLKMSRCIGRAGCDNVPNAGRGLCHTCYNRHKYNGTLGMFPTMRERTEQLNARGHVRDLMSPKVRAMHDWRLERYAERVEVAGVLVHPTVAHGRLHSYNAYGCRGAMCRVSHLFYKRTGALELPDDIRGAWVTPEDCATFDAETFTALYL